MVGLHNGVQSDGGGAVATGGDDEVVVFEGAGEAGGVVVDIGVGDFEFADHPAF